MGTYTNADGLIQHSGAQARQDYLPRVTEDSLIRELVADIYYSTDGLAVSGLLAPNFDKDAGGGATPDSFSDRVAYIPAGAVVLTANLLVKTTFAGGTSFTIGTARQDGTAIDADGFFTGTECAVAGNKLDAGKSIVAAGVDVMQTSGTFDGSCVSTTYDGYVTVTPTGTFTAGKARLVIRYLEAPAA